MITLTTTCDGPEKIITQRPEIVDEDNSTCSTIQNGTYAVQMHLYVGIRGTAFVTIVTREHPCIPPDGLRVSLSHCDEYENCNSLSHCYAGIDVIKGHCNYYCHWENIVIANTIIMHPNYDQGLELCEILV